MPPTKDIWKDICKEYSKRRPPFTDDDKEIDNSEAITEENYDPSKHTPVFFGCLYSKVSTSDSAIVDFDPALVHPVLVGYEIVEGKEPLAPTPPPNECTCSPREYLEHYIFPVLLPALECMLEAAREERCFMRKRTKFNAGDFLTEYLYRNNPNHKDRSCITLPDIPFVKELWSIHPRPPLPKSLLWSETEACLIIQAFLRGCKVRMEPEVQELRAWQRDWRMATGNIHQSVDAFWAKNMPEEVVCYPIEETVVAIESPLALPTIPGEQGSPPSQKL